MALNFEWDELYDILINAKFEDFLDEPMAQHFYSASWSMGSVSRDDENVSKLSKELGFAKD